MLLHQFRWVTRYQEDTEKKFEKIKKENADLFFAEGTRVFSPPLLPPLPLSSLRHHQCHWFVPFPFLSFSFSGLCHYLYWMSALPLHLIQVAAISVYASFHHSFTIFCQPLPFPSISVLFECFGAFGVWLLFEPNL